MSTHPVAESRGQPTAQATTASSWMPSTKTLAWSAAAAATIIAGLGLWYYSSMSGNESQESLDSPCAEPSSKYNICPSLSYLQSVAQSVADICGSNLPFSSICKGNLGLQRSQMPQLNGDTLSSYLAQKAAEGIAMSEKMIDPSTLTPAQNQLGMQNIAGMIDSFAKGTWDPCKERILSAGGYVIDGHHRWAACTLLDREMTILDINAPAETILSELSNYKGVFTLALGEANK